MKLTEIYINQKVYYYFHNKKLLKHNNRMLTKSNIVYLKQTPSSPSITDSDGNWR